jgi:hypothetical protein
LIATRPFDDGRCFQPHNGSPISNGRSLQFNYGAAPASPDLLCQTDILIPADAGTSGTYTLYWVWEWPTLDASGGFSSNETYTSCMDITMTANAVPAAGPYIASQVTNDTIESAAIEIQLSSQYLVDPTALPSLAADNPPSDPITSQPPFTPSPTPLSGFLPITTGGPAAATQQTSVTSSLAPAQTSTTAITSTTRASSTLVTPPSSTALVPVTPASTSTGPVSALTPTAAGGFVTITVTQAKEASTVTQYIASAMIVETVTMTVTPPSLNTQATISTSASATSVVPSSSKVQDAISLASGSYTTPSALPSVTPLSAVQAGKVVLSSPASVGAASNATTSASACANTTPAARARAPRIKGRRVSHKE